MKQAPSLRRSCELAGNMSCLNDVNLSSTARVFPNQHGSVSIVLTSTLHNKKPVVIIKCQDTGKISGLIHLAMYTNLENRVLRDA